MKLSFKLTYKNAPQTLTMTILLGIMDGKSLPMFYCLLAQIGYIDIVV